MRKIRNKIITPKCYFDCEMVIGPDASLENQEIRKIYDESVAMLINGTYRWVSIADFKNADGQSIGEFLLEDHEDFAVALSEEEEL